MMSRTHPKRAASSMASRPQNAKNLLRTNLNPSLALPAKRSGQRLKDTHFGTPGQPKSVFEKGQHAARVSNWTNFIQTYDQRLDRGKVKSVMDQRKRSKDEKINEIFKDCVQVNKKTKVLGILDAMQTLRKTTWNNK